jgi:hypothetical protein
MSLLITFDNFGTGKDFDLKTHHHRGDIDYKQLLASRRLHIR